MIEVMKQSIRSSYTFFMMLFGILLLPSFAFAQVTSLQSFLIKIVQFINGIIIPLLFSIALIVFIGT